MKSLDSIITDHLTRLIEKQKNIIIELDNKIQETNNSIKKCNMELKKIKKIKHVDSESAKSE